MDLRESRRFAINVADQIELRQDEIIERWEVLVQNEFLNPPAYEPILVDSLPIFLGHLSQALRDLGPSSQTRSSLIHAARTHGKERALLGSYSIGQLLREYELLRKVIFEVLEGLEPLPISVRETLFDAVTDAMRQAAIQFETTQSQRESRFKQQLQTAKDLFKSIFDLAAVGNALISSESGLFLKVNRELCRMLGTTKPQLKKMKLLDFIHPDDQGEQKQMLINARSGKTRTWTLEQRWCRVDKTEIWVLNAGSNIHFNPEVINPIVLTIVDISAMKRAQLSQRKTRLALQASQARLRLLADSMPQLVWIADPQGEAIWYNKRFLEFTGLDFPQLKGSGWKQVHHPDHVNHVVEKFNRHLESGEEWEEKFPLRNKDGKWRWFLSRAVPFRNPSGKVVQWFGTHTDITREQEFEESLLAERKGREKFISTLSHDLRTPLSFIQMAAQLAHDSDPEELSELIERIAKNANRADQMIQNLLDENRVRAGEALCVNPQEIDLVGLAKETISELKSVFGDRFVLDSVDSLQARLCPAGIRRILENLSSNAVKYGHPDHPITLSIRATKDHVTLRVHNWGEPIGAKERQTLFDLFSRSQQAELSGKKGWGIGLSVVKAVVNAHHGTVSVTSSVEDGTAFIIEMPRRLEHSDSTEVRFSPARMSAAKPSQDTGHVGDIS